MYPSYVDDENPIPGCAACTPGWGSPYTENLSKKIVVRRILERVVRATKGTLNPGPFMTAVVLMLTHGTAWRGLDKARKKTAARSSLRSTFLTFGQTRARRLSVPPAPHICEPKCRNDRIQTVTISRLFFYKNLIKTIV